jgi:hypothetical protein
MKPKKNIESLEPISQISFGGEVIIKAKKMYFINEDNLIEKIDAVISEHNGGNIQTLDGENSPANPPRGGGQ